MRRTDRLITDMSAILAVIDKCDVCRLGLSQDGRPYIVPLNFGYEYVDGNLTLYFHGAKEGQKLDIMRANPSACFEMDIAYELIEGAQACHTGMAYESVIGFGRIVICDDPGQKDKALRLLMQKYVPDRAVTFTKEQLDSVAVWKLPAESFTGKHIPKG